MGSGGGAYTPPQFITATSFELLPDTNALSHGEGLTRLGMWQFTCAILRIIAVSHGERARSR